MKHPAILLGAALLATSGLTEAATYEIDATHTYPSFSVSHMGFSLQRGQFNKTSGTIEYDDVKKTGKADITIDVRSLSTGYAERDGHLIGADWLDTAKYPTIRFVGDKFVFEGDTLSAVEGLLTIKGVSKPVKLEIEKFHCGFNPAAKKRGCGADAEINIKRSDYSVTKGLPFIGDDVEIDIQVEAYVK
jgi:polyisoprenoid-binding protein YceI